MSLAENQNIAIMNVIYYRDYDYYQYYRSALVIVHVHVHVCVACKFHNTCIY